MKVLVIGGAGYVGSILRPALEAEHFCRYLDLKPIAGSEDRCVVGDLNNPVVLDRALTGMDAVVWVAMGIKQDADRGRGCLDLDASFDVNVRGFYRVVSTAANLGIRRFVYASSLSVYRSIRRRGSMLDESSTPDAWKPYGITKRMGEFIGQALVQQNPAATFIGLRLMWPRSDADWPGNEYVPGKDWYPIGPNDLRRLFLAALACPHPGAHMMQATGDLEGGFVPNDEATRVIGWKPQGN